MRNKISPVTVSRFNITMLSIHCGSFCSCWVKRSSYRIKFFISVRSSGKRNKYASTIGCCRNCMRYHNIEGSLENVINLNVIWSANLSLHISHCRFGRSWINRRLVGLKLFLSNRISVHKQKSESITWRFTYSMTYRSIEIS